MRKETSVSVRTIETKAQDLHEKGLERWQVVIELAKVFPAEVIIKWIERQQ